MAAGSYFGKYRGTVKNNIDPMFMGRVQVSCPAVLGEGNLSWAMPSVGSWVPTVSRTACELAKELEPTSSHCA